MTETVMYEFSYSIELTPLEADIRIEDLHPLSPWREHLQIFGIGPMVYWARKLDGKKVGSPTYDFLTKGARERARKNQKAHAG